MTPRLATEVSARKEDVLYCCWAPEKISFTNAFVTQEILSVNMYSPRVMESDLIKPLKLHLCVSINLFGFYVLEFLSVFWFLFRFYANNTKLLILEKNGDVIRGTKFQCCDDCAQNVCRYLLVYSATFQLLI